MKWNNVQVLVHADYNISNSKVAIVHPGVTIKKISKFENQKYIAIDLSIAANAKVGEVKINFTQDGKTQSIFWPLDNSAREIAHSMHRE